jgi:cAMP-dependent protein kinase regulator
MYETFLSTVPLLSGLNTWEKAKIADALETEIFDRGEVVIHQGDVGEYFYLLESGEAEVIIEGRGVVKQYTRGDYFGGMDPPFYLFVVCCFPGWCFIHDLLWSGGLGSV